MTHSTYEMPRDALPSREMLALALSIPFLETAATAPSLLEFSLNESPADIEYRLGPPPRVHERDDNIFFEYNGWSFVYQLPGEQLLSITRTLDAPRPVDHLFPVLDTRWCECMMDGVRVVARARRLSRGRVLVGLGAATRECNRLLMMRSSLLSRTYPWIGLK